MEPYIGTTEIQISLQLILAVTLGLLLGAERTLAGKNAGMRTHALVALASTLLVSVSVALISVADANPNVKFDVFNVVSGIVTGMGFIGAGAILFRDQTLKGLTTAAGLWVTAAIGISIGFGFYAVGIFAAFLTLFVFRVLWFLEDRIKVLVKHDEVEQTNGTTSG